MAETYKCYRKKREMSARIGDRVGVFSLKEAGQDSLTESVSWAKLAVRSKSHRHRGGTVQAEGRAWPRPEEGGWLVCSETSRAPVRLGTESEGDSV